MKPTVFMLLEEIELLVSTARSAALVLYPHQDYGDVIYLIPLERTKACISISPMAQDLVSSHDKMGSVLK